MILNHSTNPSLEADHSTRALEINEVTFVEVVSSFLA